MSKKLIYLVSFVLVLGLTTTVASADIADGLVGYWPLDEGAGTTTSDSSGNGNDGTLNLPGWGSGKFGGALDFDGTDDYVDCGNSSILYFGTGDFTISAWIKMPSSTEVHTIWAKGGDDSGGIRYTLSMGESNDHGISMLTDDNSDKERAEGATLVDDGLWHHVVGNKGQIGRISLGTTITLYFWFFVCSNSSPSGPIAGPVISVTSCPRCASSLQVISVFSCAPPSISLVII